MRRLLPALVAFLLAVVALAAQDAQPAPGTEIEQLRAQLADAYDQIAIARAQRADCETSMGPIEAKLRSTESQQRWAQLKADMEKARAGFECDPHTLTCTKKPEPPKAPADTKDPPK